MNDVCTIIAAKNASDTIGLAVASALREPQVREVIVIDDGSTDDTAGAARRADDGSDRLRIIRFDKNRGPAAARNHAIDNSSAPLIAILDADDAFHSGRFQALLAQDGWDFIADNIAFITAPPAAHEPLQLDQFKPEPHFLDLSSFVEGNISRPGVQRGEIGFLKPVMRRAFLDAHGLRYNEALRLGEDYDLYSRTLAKGARYKVIRSCGYVAVVRGNSLSGLHRTEDLKRLYEVDAQMLLDPGLPPEAKAAIRRHEGQVRGRYELRRFLDIKAQSGIAAAFRYALLRPSAAAPIFLGVLRDKMDRFRRPAPGAPIADGRPRYLLAGVSES